MATEREVRDFVRSKREGSIEKCYGPSSLESREVWEVWVYHDDEYKTRFVVENSPQELLYFGEFQQFCPFVERLYKEQETTINKLKEVRHRNLVLQLQIDELLCSPPDGGQDDAADQ